MITRNLLVLPDDLPVPEDDNACAHLEDADMPTIALGSTSGIKVNLGLESGISVVYFYPMTGRPDAPPMIGWNEIPGARGCTLQSCSFRDHHADLLELGAKVYGVSAQSSEDQKEAVQRLHLPFELLSDSSFHLTTVMRLPTFTYNSLRLIKRLTLIIKDGSIRRVFYPVFPPNENAINVIVWLQNNNV